jgi:hypothetical protein
VTGRFRIGDVVTLGEREVEQAVAWYRRKDKLPPPPFRRLYPELIWTAYQAAGGNWHRLEILDDRTIFVHNRNVW